MSALKQNTALVEISPQDSEVANANSVAAELPKLDELDWKILSELADDARTPFQGIADKLKVDEKTVRNRMSRLRTADVLQFLPMLDAHVSEQCFVLLAGLSVTPEAKSTGETFAETLATLSGVAWCGRTIGRFDYVIEGVFPSMAKLREFETKTLPSYPGVQAAESFFVVSHHGRRKVPIFPLFDKKV